MARRKNTISEDSKETINPKEILSFDEAVEAFLKEQKLWGRTPRTLEWHRENFNALKKIFSKQGVPLELDKITTTKLKHNFMLYSMEVNGNKATTVNNRLKTFRSFWKFLKNEGYVKEDITLTIKTLKEVKKVIITLDDSEIEAMFKVCDQRTFTGLRDLTIMKTLLDTGVRLRELIKLTVEDIFFKQNLIKVDGKGQKERLVPLSPELKLDLKAYLRERGQLPTDHLFINIDNTPISRRTVQERLSIIASKANVTKQASPHIWRHTFSKSYILNEGDPFTLKKILGHSDWAMVHRYVEMFTEDVIKQHQKASPLKNYLNRDQSNKRK